MVTELKQAAGRLIRTATDKGVIAIMDPRTRSTQYGRTQVVPALPPAPLASRSESIAMFLGTLKPVNLDKLTKADRLAMAVAPVVPAAPVKYASSAYSEEIPF
jgi:hypothetical protein